jgi:hypothetical protein
MKALEIGKKIHRKALFLTVILALLSTLVITTPALAAPTISLSPSTGAIGTWVTITGTVFDSYKGDNIFVFLDGDEIPGSPLVVPDTGSFSVELIIPDGASAGRHWVRVAADSGETLVLAENFFIVDAARISLDVSDGQVGTDVTVNGQGFYSGRTVTLNYYNIIGDLIGTEASSATGTFSYRFTVPASTGGPHRITASNAEGDIAEAEFEVIPALQASLTSAGPGDLVTLSGTGFGFRSQVTITLGAPAVATARTDDYGNFEVVFNVPEIKPNPYDIRAEDEEDNVDKVKFTVTAGARLSLTQGAVGDRVTVRGTGFAAGKDVTVDYDNLRVGTDTADNNGVFSLSFDVPPSSGGEHTVTVSDGTTTKRFAFTVESDAPATPGPQLPANGAETKATAFLDWQDVTDPSQPVVYDIEVASDQNFSMPVLQKEGLTESEYTVAEEEALPAGPEPYFWRVRAMDAAGNRSDWSAPWSFRVSAPAVPSLLLPESGSDVKTPLFFNWQAVTSLSPPVTYNLQIATDLNFASLVVDEKGLTGSEYLLSEEDAQPLEKGKPLYWRVMAVDGAGNESAWSTPDSFQISGGLALPMWLLIVIICVGIIVVGFIAFRVGRRTAFSPPE